MPDVESFWHSLEEAYQAILSAPSFDAWIKTTRPLKLDNNQLWLEVPSAVHRDYWEKNLSAKIVETGFKLTGAEVMPHFVVADEKDAALAQELEEPAEEEVVFSEQRKPNGARCSVCCCRGSGFDLQSPFLLWWCRVRENPFDACYWSSNVSESTRCQSQIC